MRSCIADLQATVSIDGKASAMEQVRRPAKSIYVIQGFRDKKLWVDFICVFFLNCTNHINYNAAFLPGGIQLTNTNSCYVEHSAIPVGGMAFSFHISI